MEWVLVLFTITVGGGVAMQGVINSKLGHRLDNTWQAALISFLTGTAVLLIVNLFQTGRLRSFGRLAELPWYMYTGGALGAVFVTSAIVIVPRIGIASFLAAAVAGQLTISLLLDHAGFLGIQEQPVTPGRIAGACLLLAGVWLIQR